MTTKPHLLILDDVPEMREWLRTLIEERYPAWRVKTVGTAMEFHVAIDRERPELALLDEVLGPGEDIASLIRLTEAGKIPVALMTGMHPPNRTRSEIPKQVLRRIVKPSWETGRGTEPFLDELGAVMALTASTDIG